MQIPPSDSAANASAISPSATPITDEGVVTGAETSHKGGLQGETQDRGENLRQGHITSTPSLILELASQRQLLLREIQQILGQLSEHTLLRPLLLTLAQAVEQSPIAEIARLARALQNNHEFVAKAQLRPHLQEILQVFSRADGVTNTPLQQITQEVLQILAENRFDQLEKLVPVFRTRTMAKEVVDLRTLQTLMRALGPLTDVAHYGVLTKDSSGQYNVQTEKSTQKLQETIVRSLGIPLPARLAQALPPAIQPWSAKVMQVQSGQLQILPNIQESFDTTQKPLTITLPPQSAWNTLLKPEQIMLFQQHLTEKGPVLLPYPASANLSLPEQIYWSKTNIPPSSDFPSLSKQLQEYGALPQNPATTELVAQVQHLLDTIAPAGSPPREIDLVLRFSLMLQSKILAPELLGAIHSYLQDDGTEARLFNKLPQEIQEALRPYLDNKASPTAGPLPPRELAQILQTLLQNPITPPSPELEDAGQKLLQQLHLHRLDQESRHPGDRQESFFWMHQGELQKGRLRVRDQRESSPEKATKDQTVRFVLETHLPHLGKVQAEVQVKREKVGIIVWESTGRAEPAMQEERGSLAQELGDLGLSLQDLTHRFLPSAQQTTTQGSPGILRGNSALDVIA